MTEEEAINTAWAYVKQKSFDIVGMHSIQHFSTDLLPEQLRNRGDFWVVRFDRSIPANCIESPDLILITVLESTGEVSVFDSL